MFSEEEIDAIVSIGSVKKLIFFDLDGTLIDSSRDIVNAMNFALEKVNLSKIPYEVMRKFTGQGVQKVIFDCFNYLGVCGDNLLQNQVKDYFNQFYDAHLFDETKLKSKVKETLQELKNIKKIVLTNKSSCRARKILEALGIIGEFTEIIGGDDEEKLKPLPDNVLSMLKKYSISPANALLVGDTFVDVQTARNAGIDSCIVVSETALLQEVFETGANYICLNDISGILEICNIS